MKKTFIILGMLIFGLSVASPAVADLINFTSNPVPPGEPNGPFFLDDIANRASLGPPVRYYRDYTEDWGWQHGLIGGTITSATLRIKAWDVDVDPYWESPEIDLIQVSDNGSWTTLPGHLDGANNTYKDTIFNLGSQFFDDIGSGLQVRIVIDDEWEGEGDQHWRVTLVESELLSQVPEPATVLLLGTGLLGIWVYGRRRFNKK